MEKLEKLENLIIKACKPHAGKPLALSGGIDSSLLAAIIKPEFVVSVELPMGKPYNESEYSKKAAEYLGLKRIVVKPNKKDEFINQMENQGVEWYDFSIDFNGVETRII